jgi:hypothetical protein
MRYNHEGPPFSLEVVFWYAFDKIRVISVVKNHASL